MKILGFKSEPSGLWTTFMNTGIQNKWWRDEFVVLHFRLLKIFSGSNVIWNILSINPLHSVAAPLQFVFRVPLKKLAMAKTRFSSCQLKRKEIKIKILPTWSDRPTHCKCDCYEWKLGHIKSQFLDYFYFMCIPVGARLYTSSEC